MDRPARAEIGDFSWFLREREKKHAVSTMHILSSFHSWSNQGSGRAREGHKLRYPNSISVRAAAIAPAAAPSPLQHGCSLWSTGWVSRAGPTTEPIEEYGTWKEAQKRFPWCLGTLLNCAVGLTSTPQHQPKLLFLEAGILVLQTSIFSSVSHCCRWLIHHEAQAPFPLSSLAVNGRLATRRSLPHLCSGNFEHRCKRWFCQHTCS